MIINKVCVVCNRAFKGGPRAKYCLICREDAKREAIRRYRKKGVNRPLGSKDICSICGKEYIVNAGSQKYCLECRHEQYKTVRNEQSLEWYRHNNSNINARRRSKHTGIKKCIWCGKEFISHTKANTCSDECRRAHKNANWVKNYNKRKKR